MAALAYALLGGSSARPRPTCAGAAPSASAAGIAVTSTTPEHAVAETTDGVKEQSAARPATRSRCSPEPASGAPTTSRPAPRPRALRSVRRERLGRRRSPKRQRLDRNDDRNENRPRPNQEAEHEAEDDLQRRVEFGTLPPGITPETAQLTPFTNLKLQTPLPSAQQPLLVFRGVTAKGKSATFTLVGEAILPGTGACLPSATQCEAVDLKPGETEQLRYLAPDGQATIYELRVLEHHA